MTVVSASGTLELPAEVVFDYAADYRRMPEWVFGLDTVEPVGELSEGVGAEFRGTGKIGPIAMTGTSRIIEWEPYEQLTEALVTNNGIVASATVATTPIGSKLTRIDLTVDYKFPGGFAGKVLQRGIEPLLGSGIRHSVRVLRRHCLRTC
ncbi:SRPBCC family protein [Mycobacterium sp. 29Ha]|uniref:SRPBCC family protein n=1 Tax=Mycobacterium sp. 29Ha TaxID=2939268 RepID=UPI002939335E|nr:SRPBCC family protein [Mycobacterium sp. 29Ha]MDV3133248.1 SRPBCC family protein [Mycobacterium sp. 29Ha]